MRGLRVVLLWLALCWHIISTNTQNYAHNKEGPPKPGEAILESPLCCNLTVEHVDVDYTSKIVENEYIVMFNGYYKNQARANYIETALNNTGLKRWKIVERENPASDFPSDFDVIVLEDTESLQGKFQPGFSV